MRKRWRPRVAPKNWVMTLSHSANGTPDRSCPLE
jgi:hypothetical protein